MPNYKGHLVGGTGAYVFTLALLNPRPLIMAHAVEWLMFTLIGSLFPDIDIKSKGQKLFYHMLLASFIILVILQRLDILVVLSFISITPLLARHRGIFHQAWFLVAVPFGAWYFMSLYFPSFSRIFLFDALFFCIGSLSHIVLDFYIGPWLKR